MERFSASVAGRLMVCPGSANLELAIPNWVPPVRDPEAGAKGDGTMRHAWMEQILTHSSAKQMEAFALMLATVADLRRLRRFKMLVEHTFDVDWLPSKPKTTVDLVLYTQDELHVIDFKFGVIPVVAEGNDQCLFYAANALAFSPKAQEIHVHILQPGGHSQWTITRADLLAWMLEAVKADQRILDQDLTLQPSDHCTFCPANPHSRGDKGRPLCPEMMQLLYPVEPFDSAAFLAELDD